LLLAGLALAAAVLVFFRNNIGAIPLTILLIINGFLIMAGLALCLGELAATVAVRLKTARDRQKAIRDKRRQALQDREG